MSRFRFSYRLILLPSFVGLVCYGCSASSTVVIESDSSDLSNRKNIEPQLDGSKPSPLATPQPIFGDIDEDREVAFTSSVSSDAYQVGVELASSADALTESALSPDDWDLIVSRWQRAIDSLEQVDTDDLHYALAQEKIAAYTVSVAAAEKRLAELRTPVYVPLPNVSRASTEPATSSSIESPLATTASSSTAELPTQIPIVRRLHGTPVVLVTFNASRTYEMILDTGASRTLITRRMADELGVIPTERMLAATASQSEVSFDIGQVSSIEMGDVVLRDAPVTIGDAVSLGLLGNDFLRGYDITIRAQENVVELVRSR